MITVKLFGGLGNQLFQYSFGQYAAKTMRKEVFYDVQTKLDSKNFTQRQFELDYFDLLIDFSNNKVKSKYTLFSRLKRKLIQKIPTLSNRYYIQNNVNSFIRNLKDNIYYEGYWQNLEYLIPIEEQIKTQIIPSPNFYEKFQTLLEKIGKQESASIHIRRADYINIKVNAKIFHVCEIDYYQKAIKKLKNEKQVKKFYIFTQDMEWAKENFKDDYFFFVEGNSAIEDMLLMSKCPHNIIANSTFSWWSAWLNENKDKMVIAPNLWHKNKKQNKDVKKLIPSNWIQL